MKKAKSTHSGNKTLPTKTPVASYISKINNPVKKKDAKLAQWLLAKITGKKAVMWGPSIVGFGSYHYKYESGREGDMCLAGFSVRSSSLVFYVVGGVPASDPLWDKLGQFKLGKSCLYVKRLEDVDINILQKIFTKSVKYMRAKYDCK